jgi:hypothetical protein
MKIITVFLLSIISIQLYACNSNKSKQQEDVSIVTNTDTMNITIGSNVFVATLLDNETATAFKAMLPLTINMTELNSNEKYADLSHNLPAKASNPETINAGDLMLYGKNTLVLFYKTFKTSYTYTKLGQVNNIADLQAALGSKDVTVTFALKTIK